MQEISFNKEQENPSGAQIHKRHLNSQMRTELEFTPTINDATSRKK